MLTPMTEDETKGKTDIRLLQEDDQLPFKRRAWRIPATVLLLYQSACSCPYQTAMHKVEVGVVDYKSSRCRRRSRPGTLPRPGLEL